MELWLIVLLVGIGFLFLIFLFSKRKKKKKPIPSWNIFERNKESTQTITEEGSRPKTLVNNGTCWYAEDRISGKQTECFDNKEKLREAIHDNRAK